MGISDALAGFVGERWGRKTISIFNTQKTILGAIVFYFSSLVITLILAPQLLPIVFIIPFILTMVEFTLVFGLDNLILPIVAGLLFLNFF